MATLIKSNGEKSEVKPSNGKTFSLKELQTFVGGWIQKVYTTKGDVMVINEEGRLHDLPPNVIATKLYTYDIIVGDVLVCKSNEFE